MDVTLSKFNASVWLIRIDDHPVRIRAFIHAYLSGLVLLITYSVKSETDGKSRLGGDIR